jgi:hypothetical protein
MEERKRTKMITVDNPPGRLVVYVRPLCQAKTIKVFGQCSLESVYFGL